MEGIGFIFASRICNLLDDRKKGENGLPYLTFPTLCIEKRINQYHIPFRSLFLNCRKEYILQFVKKIYF